MTALSRRELLRRFGLTAASVPLLEAFGARAFAQAATPKKRIVSIVAEHGLFPQHWLPHVPNTLPISTMSPGSLLQAPSAYLRPSAFTQRAGCKAIDLMPTTGALSPVFSAKWRSVLRKTLFLRDLGHSNRNVQGHTSTAMLGGFSNPQIDDPDISKREVLTGESLDVVVGRKLNGRAPLVLKGPDYIDDVRFLEGTFGSPSFRKNGASFERLSYFRDPVKVWDRLFSGFMPPSQPGRSKNDRRVALIDRTLKGVNGLLTDSRLSAYDREKLGAHAAILEQQKASISAMVPPAMAPLAMPPARPALGDVSSTSALFAASKGSLFKAMLRNASGAIKLGSEQAVTIGLGLENDWLSDGLNLGGSQAYHGSAGHLTTPSLPTIEEVRKVQQFVFDAIADFLVDLDTVEDATTGATYLDNTLVFITFEHDGQPNGHLRFAMPSIFAGGFGKFQGGTLLDYATPALAQESTYANYRGLSYSRAVFSILDFFGVTAAERANMDIQGVAQDWFGADLTGWNQPLTGLT